MGLTDAGAGDALLRAETRRLFLLWLVTAGLLWPLSLLSALVWAIGTPIGGLYLFQQDTPLLLGGAILWALLCLRPPNPLVMAWKPPRAWPWILALAAGLIALLGEHYALLDYPMTLDEFWAVFDSKIIAHGEPIARVADAWRPYANALQPTYLMRVPGSAFWVSTYLPGNAALRAVASLVGADVLVNPLWTAVAVLAVVGIARKLWPDRPAAALLAGLFVATSSQVLVTGMTAFAMPAHLGLNLLWMWAFLRGDWRGHVLAIACGALATGLHQIVFHPLFVAPFVLQLWLDRRWRLAGVYTAAYAAICLFWVLYWSLAFRAFGVQAAQAAGAGDTTWFINRVVDMLSHFRISNGGGMAMDLLRFMTWQHPLVVPLALSGFAPALRAGGILRSLALGVLLTLLTTFILLPVQDHGWGDRYLHGELGSVCLLAAWNGSRIWARLDEAARPSAVSLLLFATVASVMLMTPFCIYKTAEYVRPYARAQAAIARTDADVVIVDNTRGWYVEAVIRNDPYLANRPKVMAFDRLRGGKLKTLCDAHSLALFDAGDAARFGLGGRHRDAHAAWRRDFMSWTCGGLPVREVVP